MNAASGHSLLGAQPLRRMAVGRMLCGLAVVCSSPLLCAPVGHGASLVVSAHVLPAAHLQMSSEPPPLLISAADVAQGYADVPQPLRLHVDSNSRAGFALDIATLSPWFTAVTLQGLDSEVLLEAPGGTVVQRWQGQRSRTLELRVRFKLAPTVQPGIYAWPLQLAARPL